MGKIKQTKRVSAHRTSATGKVPLAEEIESLKLAKNPSSTRASAASTKASSQQADDEDYVDQKITAKILSEARRQQTELQDECDDNEETPPPHSRNPPSQFKKFQSNFIEQQKIRKSVQGREDDSSSDDTDNDLDPNYRQRSGEYFSGDEEIHINEADERAFDRFMGGNKGSQQRRTIADIIMEKLTEKKTEMMSEADERGSMVAAQPQLDDRVIKMYSQIKDILGI